MQSVIHNTWHTHTYKYINEVVWLKDSWLDKNICLRRSSTCSAKCSLNWNRSHSVWRLGFFLESPQWESTRNLTFLGFIGNELYELKGAVWMTPPRCTWTWLHCVHQQFIHLLPKPLSGPSAVFFDLYCCVMEVLFSGFVFFYLSTSTSTVCVNTHTVCVWTKLSWGQFCKLRHVC